MLTPVVAVTRTGWRPALTGTSPVKGCAILSEGEHLKLVPALAAPDTLQRLVETVAWLP